MDVRLSGQVRHVSTCDGGTARSVPPCD
jgi:hypothetical protein